MCYTIEINLTKAELEKRFGSKTSKLRDFNPRYIVSAFGFPKLPVITMSEPLEFNSYNWGLIPFWVKNRKAAFEIRMKTFNARAETLAEKPSFRESFKTRRCLIPVHGFFEWHEHDGKKYPFYIRLKNDRAFALAGIYDKWDDMESGEIIYSFSIVTTAANPLMEKIHNSKKRMPVIFPEESERDWLDINRPHMFIKDLCASFNQELLEAYPVARINPARAEQTQSEEALKPFCYPELESFLKNNH
jgi:putative SOS response-associated peptidase YedK